MLVEVEKHEPNEAVKALRLGLYGLAGASIFIATSPFIFPALGIGAGIASEASILCGIGTSTGLAGWSAGLLANIPFIGTTLAAGGLLNAAASAAIGVGGVLAANQIEQAEGRALARQADAAGHEQKAPWLTLSGVVRTVALATSILVALPAILPAINMGIQFLAPLLWNNGLLSTDAAYGVMGWSEQVIGKLGEQGASNVSQGLASINTLLLPHLASCGAAMGIGALAAGSAHQHLGHKEGEEVRFLQSEDLAKRHPHYNIIAAGRELLGRIHHGKEAQIAVA